MPTRRKELATLPPAVAGRVREHAGKAAELLRAAERCDEARRLALATESLANGVLGLLLLAVNEKPGEDCRG